MFSKMFSKCYILVVGMLKCPVIIMEVEYSLIIMKGSCSECILSLDLCVKNSKKNKIKIVPNLKDDVFTIFYGP